MKKQTPLITLCHPYIFALKEGQYFSNDLMDYSLLLLHRDCSEVIKSPLGLKLSRRDLGTEGTKATF